MKMEIQWFICQFWSLCLCMRWNRQMFKVNEWMNYLSIIIAAATQTKPIKTNWLFLKHFTTPPQLHVQPHELLAEGDGKAEQFDRQHSCLVPKRFQLTNKNYKATQTKKRQFDKQHSCMVPKRFQLTKSLPWNLMTNRQKEAATQGASNLPPAFVTDVHRPGIHLPLPLQASREGEWGILGVYLDWLLNSGEMGLCEQRWRATYVLRRDTSVVEWPWVWRYCKLSPLQALKVGEKPSVIPYLKQNLNILWPFIHC